MTDTTGVSFRLRPARPADIARVDALLSRTYPRLLKHDYPPSTLVTAVPMIARARPELMRCGTYYLAETGTGEIVGAGGWTRRRRRAGWADIRHFVTDHRLLRQGIGRAIMGRILAEAAEGGIRHLDCWSSRSAVPFYQAMGFVALGPIEVPLARGIVFPAVQMQRGV